MHKGKQYILVQVGGGDASSRALSWRFRCRNRPFGSLNKARLGFLLGPGLYPCARR